MARTDRGRREQRAKDDLTIQKQDALICGQPQSLDSKTHILIVWISDRAFQYAYKRQHFFFYSPKELG